MSPGGQTDLVDRLLHETAPRLIQLAVLSHQRPGEPGVARSRSLPFMLSLARGDHPRANRRGGLSGLLGRDLPVRHSGDVNMEIDPVQQRTRDAVAVLRDLGRRAEALPRGASQEAALAPLRWVSVMSP